MLLSSSSSALISSRTPLNLRRYASWTYKQYKSNPYIDEGYFLRQHDVFRTIASQILDQALF